MQWASEGSSIEKLPKWEILQKFSRFPRSISVCSYSETCIEEQSEKDLSDKKREEKKPKVLYA